MDCLMRPPAPRDISGENAVSQVSRRPPPWRFRTMLRVELNYDLC
jgi:hypothetical protein